MSVINVNHFYQTWCLKYFEMQNQSLPYHLKKYENSYTIQSLIRDLELLQYSANKKRTI